MTNERHIIHGYVTGRDPARSDQVALEEQRRGDK